MTSDGHPRTARYSGESSGVVEPYWSAGDDERLTAFEESIHGLRAVGERYPDDEFAGWNEQAVDPREMRDK